ncbi:peptide-methionine (R)-S-oxide reductase MsrB [uncultured Mucilaginibacter sp.]|uniref:peptide-methionine (R)-S-oxide reductase MsrB n=1 Tax=uncultured Mucilaginibacter sp. TaxID=797541 RepID=UPI0025D2E1BC|nr:peptide-methionine (R)-S-oxide reductase MsrB [uncultured Mucilaginibacter sp.]
MKTRNIFAIALLLMSLSACSQNKPGKITPGSSEDVKTFPGAKPNSYWKTVLSPDAYYIMVNKGTETPFRNPYWDNHKKGIYVSAATGKPLFSSDTKFDSGTGWPSFYQPINDKDIMIVEDDSYGEVRQEVLERSTGLHLGHVFDDGPLPTGKRYCLDSYALKFIPAK